MTRKRANCFFEETWECTQMAKNQIVINEEWSKQSAVDDATY